ncbi:UvrD-helicase domain-containing protein [Rhodococcus sp. NPDC058481]|uniref:UvrD-helicase domain-containing protein n=1 Tax=unclassified Rhodococcus (in: high G+C Gram-positive bacteria) TaxID=192944 RepID=UPI00364CCC3E
MQKPITAFELLGPLPRGTTVLEASAGTGKTYAIVGLAVRFVAEVGVDPSDLLLVTFTKAATKELRERTRDRFASVARALADPTVVDPDPLIAHLAAGTADEVATRIRLLRQALSNFDAVTIATTHSFCQRVLDGLGFAGERDPDAEMVEEATDIRDEAIGDLYLRTFARNATTPMTPQLARTAARMAVFDPHAVLAPQNDEGTQAGDAVAFAAAVRAELLRRKRSAGIRDFDDLPALLHGVLADPVHGEAACRRVRDQFAVVLVDEFQDTDPLQWGILGRAFHGHSTLVLVGDPKQAIYAFRGAEVLSYIDAVGAADSHQELITNWRSDAGLLDALAHLQVGARLGHDQIVVNPVDAAKTGSRLTGTPPMRLRVLPRHGAGPLNKSGMPAVGPLRSRVARDVAADIVALLEGDARLTLGGGPRPVAPGDIAVLVKVNNQALRVHAELTRAGIPCVLAGGTSVFVTASAQDWLWLLQAIEQPHRADRVRLAALTPLLGYTAADLDTRGEEIVGTVGGQLRDLAATFARSGFAALFERLAAIGSLESRLLSRPSGERTLTDLRHIAQLLNAAAVEQSLGLTSITRWLTDRIQDPASGGLDRSRRLDSDSAAVQISTVHASKGLEYPIVYLPFGWDPGRRPTPDTLLLHDDHGQRIRDVGGPSGNGYAERLRRHKEEEAGEELRLLYVALTRAKCQVVAWWAPGFATSSSPLHRMLLGRSPGGAEVPASAGVPDDSVIASRLTDWAAGANGTIEVEFVGPDPIPDAAWARAGDDAGELAAARFERVLDQAWRRTSYSALTASAHDTPGVGSEVEDAEKADEPAEPPLTVVAAAGPGIASPMNGMAAGAIFGLLVHAVLEVVDTAADDLDAELLRCCEAEVAATMSAVDPAALASALGAVMRTPLAGAGPTLAEIAPSNRLPELEFEIPLAGGDTPAALTVMLDGLAGLLREHLPASDALAAYVDHLATLEPTPLRGYLTGSIDAVLRLPGGRFVIVDYKTNRLAPGDLTTDNFTREAMAAEMMRAHYPLQALLYSVALHRYLRWRLPGYDPAVHLGGAQYLFVRGMVGPDTPAGCGVFDWTPPAALVTGLSDLLAGIGAGHTSEVTA